VEQVYRDGTNEGAGAAVDLGAAPWQRARFRESLEARDRRRPLPQRGATTARGREIVAG
jgi:hypothetical protein